jgi:hypothetical protein
MSQKQYRLLARAQIDGEVREPGYVFTLADGELGPHKTMVSTNTGGMAWRQFSEPELLPPEARRFHSFARRIHPLDVIGGGGRR